MSFENVYNDLVYKYFKENFYKNKKYEDIAGNLVLNYFNNNIIDNNLKYNILQIANETNYKKMLYDLEIYNEEHNIKIEIKTDHKSNITNNFFIEYKQYGKPSGILTTEADFYVINDTNNYYIILVDHLKEVINILKNEGILKKNKHLLRIHGEVIKDGNNNPFITEGFLIPKNKIIEYGIKL